MNWRLQQFAFALLLCRWLEDENKRLRQDARADCKFVVPNSLDVVVRLTTILRGGQCSTTRAKSPITCSNLLCRGLGMRQAAYMQLVSVVKGVLVSHY